MFSEKITKNWIKNYNILFMRLFWTVPCPDLTKACSLGYSIRVVLKRELWFIICIHGYNNTCIQ